MTIAGNLKRKLFGHKREPGPGTPRIFYCHVPKCAGSAIAQHLRTRVFGDLDVTTFTMHVEASREAAAAMQVPTMDLREMVLAYHLSLPKCHFGHGHVYCRPHIVDRYSDQWQFMTVLRPPVDRCISEFVYKYHDRANADTLHAALDEYLGSPDGQAGASWFLRYFSAIPRDHRGDVDAFVDQAVETLGRFALVGTSVRLESWCEAFRARFGIDLQIPRRNTSRHPALAEQIHHDPKLVQRIQEMCEPDQRIYDRVIGPEAAPSAL